GHAVTVDCQPALDQLVAGVAKREGEPRGAGAGIGGVRSEALGDAISARRRLDHDLIALRFVKRHRIDECGYVEAVGIASDIDNLERLRRPGNRQQAGRAQKERKETAQQGALAVCPTSPIDVTAGAHLTPFVQPRGSSCSSAKRSWSCHWPSI